MIQIKIDRIGKCYKMKNNDVFWALRNFTMDVEHGEIVGIVGSNGAGKSTLLKICSRVVSPTSGRINIAGRVGSLLEVGTGFHPELTGMENIYFNGAILGISRKEITASLDEIIKFSGVEKFIDTPVKRYSSGMYTRLAFSIAAQLDVETMIVDEVLAVGDADFQQRCLAKMGNMSKSGRTILFVSHDMSAITRLCTRAAWLHDGEIKTIGDPHEVVQSYITHSVPRGCITNVNDLLKLLPEDSSIRINKIEMTQNGNASNVFFRDYPIKISIDYTILKKEPGLRIFVRVLNEKESLVMRSYHDTHEAMILNPGTYRSTITIPENILAHRNYEISIGALVFNQRTCTGNINEGIRIPLQVETISHIDSYPEEANQYRPLTEPIINWETLET